MMNAVSRVTAILVLAACSMSAAGRSHAGCGDVTGDGNILTTDALAVLQSSVGRPVELLCTYDDVFLDRLLSPNFGTEDLVSGFVPDPFTLPATSGGPLRADYLGGNCRGSVTSNPDFRVNYTSGDFSPLRFYFIADGEDADTTLIVSDPDTYYHCSDDSFGTFDPTVDIVDPFSGTYNIWIGSYDAGTTHPGTLYVTELETNHP